MSDDIDQTAQCKTCGGDIEHYAGIPGSEYMTPYWSHVHASDVTHPAIPAPATIREVPR